MSTPVPGRRLGRILLLLAWGAGLFLATRYFAQWESRQENPNSQVRTVQGAGYIEVALQSNRQGHFVLDGALNGETVTFMLDTGATDVAIPEALAQRLQLAKGAAVTLSTANGRTEGYRTRIDNLRLGDIVLHDVRALVVPGLTGSQVLLGMSALKQLEFTQRGGNLLLRQDTNQPVDRSTNE